MNKTWLVLDCNGLCYQAFYGMNDLSWDEQNTATIYGFFQSLVALIDLHQTKDVVFCWDYGEPYRINSLKTYKESRKIKEEQASDEHKEAKKDFYRQVRLIRDELLVEMGFRNVLKQDCYEADDLIASVVKYSIDEDDEAIIVSTDKDMYQLLRGHIRIWNNSTHKVITLQSFRKLYGVYASDWAQVKAMAGCATDDVPGINGVAELTACKYIRNELNPGVIVSRIEASKDLIERNLLLVELPYPGTKKYKLVDDQITEETWSAVCKRYGMNSIRNMPPIKGQRHG